MRVDRVEEDVYVFVSDEYAQVTATVFLTPQGAVVVDTMPFPTGTRQILSFIEAELGPDSVRYVIATHHHADHVNGTYLFEGAEMIAHDSCREILRRVGAAGLAHAKRSQPQLAEVELRLPDLTFQRQMHLRVGHRHMRLFHTPGHAPDAISVFVMGDRILVAGDIVMPVPYIAHGNLEHFRANLAHLKTLKASFLVQGHGDVLLRGEVNETIDRNLKYLDAITEKVQELVRRGAPRQELVQIGIEDCGLSRIPLDGLVSKLHLDNLTALYNRYTAERGTPS